MHLDDPFVLIFQDVFEVVDMVLLLGFECIILQPFTHQFENIINKFSSALSDGSKRRSFFQNGIFL